jgi:TolB-like protein/tetratricopeptide (TPR) repeat protein
MPRTLRFDTFEVDLDAHQLYKRGVRIRLRDQSFRVLALLVEHAGQVITREELRQRLWGNDVFVDFENSLNTAVARLREALSDSADRPRYIETLPRLGYRFIASVTESPRIPTATPLLRSKTRLIVLPIVNSSGDPSQEYLGDAMTDEIITALSAVAPADLGVIARTTAMHYKHTQRDVAAIARELSVDWVVEGSILPASERVTLTVHLIRATDQTRVFGQRYTAGIGDMFTVAQTVAQSFGEQIGIVHPIEERRTEAAATAPRAPQKPTEDPVAYNCYIQGRYHLWRGESPQSWAKAREYLEGAIERDPRFALAYDALAELWWTAGFFGVVAPKKTLEIGMAYAVRALEIDNSLAEGHAMLAQYRKQVDFNWAEVEREMALALDLNPNSAIVRMRLVTSLMPFGRLDEAIAHLQFALELDPLGLFPRAWLLIMFWLSRQYGRAIDQGRVLLAMKPAHFAAHLALGCVFREARMFDDAIAALRKAAESSGDAPLILGWLGLALAESGDSAGARALLNRLRALPSTVYVPPTSLAWIHLGLGEIDEFFEWMNGAIDARDHMIMPIKTYPFLDPIRADPRFQSLLRRMHLDQSTP